MDRNTAFKFLQDRVGMTYYEDDTTPKNVEASVDSVVSVMIQFAKVHSMKTVEAINTNPVLNLSKEDQIEVQNSYPIETIV